MNTNEDYVIIRFSDNFPQGLLLYMATPISDINRAHFFANRWTNADLKYNIYYLVKESKESNNYVKFNKFYLKTEL